MKTVTVNWICRSFSLQNDPDKMFAFWIYTDIEIFVLIYKIFKKIYDIFEQGSENLKEADIVVFVSLLFVTTLGFCFRYLVIDSMYKNAGNLQWANANQPQLEV